MDALQKAREQIEAAEPLDTFAYAELACMKAQAYAAIAQAEQLKRIADALYSTRYDTVTSVAESLSELASSVSRMRVY